MCTDLATSRAVDGGHCASTGGSSSCQLTCPSDSAPSSPDSGSSSDSKEGNDASHSGGDASFCRGSGYDMYMGGFVSALGAGGEGVSFDCLVLFFAGWKLDSGLKFAAACIFIFGLGVLIEFCTTLRRDLFKKVHNCASHMT